MLASISAFFDNWGSDIWVAVVQTFQMVGIALAISIVIGLPLGVLLILTGKGKALDNKILHQSLNFVINVIRSIPFIILLFFILPFTKLIAGTTIDRKSVVYGEYVEYRMYIAISCTKYVTSRTT